jgi:hypothetical protein
VESIDSLYAPGGRIEGGMFTVTAVEAQAVAPEVQEARALVVYDVTPTRQVGPQGETLREVEAISNKAGDLVLTRSGGEWLMRDFA